MKQRNILFLSLFLTTLLNASNTWVPIIMGDIITFVSKPEASGIDTNDNQAPIANAGIDQNVMEDDSVTLSASASSDNDGTIIHYEWKENAVILSTAVSFIKADFTVGTHTITLTVTDDDGATATDTVQVVVNVPENQPPIANTQSVTMNEDSSQSITLSGSDPDGDTLIYTIITQPVHGVLSGTAPNVTYTPTANYFGSDSFSFKVNDGTVDSSIATVSITINDVVEVNHVPIANSQSIAMSENTRKSITLIGSDVDGDTLTYIITTQPTHGILGSIVSNNVTYTPDQDYFGTDSFSFKVNDEIVDSSIATVSITINDVVEPNQAPIANAGTDQSVIENESVTLNASVSSDNDGNIISYEWKENATLLSTAVSFTKSDFTVGTHTITLTVTDDDGATAIDTVVVVVSAQIVECQATLATEEIFTDSYIDIAHEDRPWVKNLTEVVTVEDIAAEFNTARATDATITSSLMMPSQAVWDTYSDSQKALYLLNNERCARGIRPFEGIDTNIQSSPAQYYADYLKDNNVLGHQEDGSTPWERLTERANVFVGTNADFYSYAENLAMVAYGSSAGYPTIHEPVSMAVYAWIYNDKEDTSGSYGHRKFALSVGLEENFGEENKEGLIGVGVATTQYYSSGFYWTKVYTVLNGFDPNDAWDNGVNIIRQ